MAMNIKSVIFDWSGTISDDVELVSATACKVSKVLGGREFTLEEFKEQFELPYINFYKKMGVSASRNEIDKLYKKFYDEVGIKPKIFPDVKETIEWLQKKGLKLGVLSTVLEEFVIREAKGYEIFNYFYVIKGSVMDKREGIDEVIKRVGVPASQILYVGDMDHDIIVSREIGTHCAVVTTGYQSEEKLLSYNPEFIFEKFSGIKTLF